MKCIYCITGECGLAGGHGGIDSTPDAITVFDGTALCLNCSQQHIQVIAEIRQRGEMIGFRRSSHERNRDEL